ncbi:MAG: thiamine-phosphate kinase [Proteobacteria bacterium]|nr:thiamine-phosphate kinase [Pseudomonadota bacterium]
MDEFSLIAELFAPLARGAPEALGLTDDAAVVEVPPGRRLVVTTDMVVAGGHFLADDPPAMVARKLLRVNLSDLAAMGAAPRTYLLALAVPRGTKEDWLEDFAAGLAEDQETYGIHLIGGDIVATDGPLVASLTALGEVSDGGEVLRSGARPGDLVFVSGTLGDAALGLRTLRGELAGVDAAGRAALVDRYRLPQPRLALGARLSGIAHAAIDVSDGLVADLGHICECSKVGAEVEAERLPLSPAAQAAVDADRSLSPVVLTGGDDYEIAFTAGPEVAGQVAELAAALALPLTKIGRITAGAEVRVVDDAGADVVLGARGYRHF